MDGGTVSLKEDQVRGIDRAESPTAAENDLLRFDIAERHKI